MVSILKKKKNLKSRMELKQDKIHVKWICKFIKDCLLGLISANGESSVIKNKMIY